MADTGVNFWVNPFQILRLSGKDEMQRPVEFTSKEAGGDDVCCENGDKSIFRNYASRPPTPGSQTKSIPMPTRNTNARGHPFTSTSDPASPKDVTTYYTPETIAELVDKATVLAQLATTPSKDTSYLNMFNNMQSTKYLVDEPKPPKKHLKRSVSFNHSSRPTSPRQNTSSRSSYIDVSEVLATTVSLVRENNRRLDKYVDVKTEGGFSENDNEYWSDEPEDETELHKKQIDYLSTQLENMELRFHEQVSGQADLIEALRAESARLEKDGKRKCAEIARLEEQLEMSRQAISELVEQQQREAASQSHQTSETLRHFEAELREKNKAIDQLNKRITVSSRQVSDSKEKEKRLEALTSHMVSYQSLETELSSQLEKLRSCKAELSEKDAMIESLNIRLDTSQQVIAELREKHAPNDLLRQLRQKDYIIDNLTQQVENIDADLKDKDDEIEALARKLAEEAKLMEKLQKSQLTPLRKRAEEAERQLAEKERLLTELEQNYRESSRTAENGTEKLRAQEKTISALRQEVMELRRELTTQASQNREKERMIVSTREEMGHIRANFQGLLNALSEKDQKIQQLDQHIESLQQQAAAAKNQAGGSKDQSKGKNEVRFNALQKVLNTKIESCRDYEKKISQLEAEFSNLKKVMDDGKTTSSEKDIKIQRLVKMNRELKDEVTQLKEKMEAKEKELIVLKSRIPHPTPGSAPAASVRSSPKSVKSRVSSMYSLSGGESSSDETGKIGHVKAASISGYPSPLRPRSGIMASTISSRRLSDVSKTSSSTVPRVSLTRTKSTASTSSEDVAFRKKAALTQLAAKREVKPRKPTTPSTVEVLKKKTTTKETSPINRLAVTQRKRDMGVINNMLSGVAPDRKNKVSTLAQRRSTTTGSSTSTRLDDKKKLCYNTASSDSDSDRKQTSFRKSSSDLTTIMEKIKRNNGSTSTETSVGATTSTAKPRTSLTRPLSSKKPSSTS